MSGTSLRLQYLPDLNSEEKQDSKPDEKPGQHVAFSQRGAFDIIDTYLNASKEKDAESAAPALLDMMPDREQY